MLTKHNYQDIPKNWDDGKIADCCKKPTDNGDGCNDCCYDTWQKELKDITQKYNQETEDTSQLQKQYDFLKSRRDKYKTWLDELKKAEDLSLDICRQLDLIAVQSRKVWYNSCKAVDAIETLFCMVREFYMQIDYLKARYEILKNCIDKNTDPSLADKTKGIPGCLAKYAEKLEVIVKTRDEIITALIAAIKLANLIRNNIYTQDCPPDNYNPCADQNPPCNCNESTDTVSSYGFKTIICEWYCSFKCDEKCPEPDPCKEKDQPMAQMKQQQNTSTDPCEVGCEPEPTISFPICKDNYRICVEKWYRADDTAVKQLGEDLNTRKKNKEALLACKNSLDAAIAEAKPANRC